MAFRVLIAGGRHFTNYPLLRATLDTLLANRLPEVELLTTGGLRVGTREGHRVHLKPGAGRRAEIVIPSDGEHRYGSGRLSLLGRQEAVTR
jgi:hypothetical protein